jgi:hypothetical protein
MSLEVSLVERVHVAPDAAFTLVVVIAAQLPTPTKSKVGRTWLLDT